MVGSPGKASRGFTLLEACIVLSICGIVASASVPGLQRLLEGRRLGGVAAQLATDIQFVRSEAVARNQVLRLSIHAAAGAACYVIHTGAAAQCTCAAVGAAVCTGDAEQIRTVHLPEAERIGLQANVSSIAFDPLHGTSTPSGTLRITAADGREVRHVINVMGRVRSCSTQGGVPSYRAC